MDEEERRYSSFSKEDCRKLQVIQNKVLRLHTGLPFDTPTTELFKQSEELSIYQQIAYHTLLLVHNVISNKKPSYLSERLQLKLPTETNIFPHRQAFTIEVNRELSLSRGAFMYRGAKLFNMLPINLHSCNIDKNSKLKPRFGLETPFSSNHPKENATLLIDYKLQLFNHYILKSNVY